MDDKNALMPDPLESDEDIELTNLALLLHAIDDGDRTQVLSILEGEHPADISDQLEKMTTDERTALVDLASETLTPSVLSELEDEVLEDVLPLLEASQISEALNELDSDDATQIIEEMDDDRREEVMSAMSPADRSEFESHFAFDEDTAGRLMQREFVAAPQFWTAGQTIDQIRAQGVKGEDTLPDLFFNVYVVDQAFRPIAYVPISKLLQVSRDIMLTDIALPIVFEIPRDMDQEDIAYNFEKYHLISAPVIDESGRLCGMITVDDIVDVIQDENKEDLLALAGVSDAGLTDTAFSIVAARAPWLFINLLTAILASFVISAFDYAIASLVALAVLMPIVASMGGNAGTQALAVAVRALTERDLSPAHRTTCRPNKPRSSCSS